MAYSYVSHVGDGAEQSFSYASLASKLLPTTYSPVLAQLVVYVDDVAQTLTTDYTIDTGDQEIDFVSAPADDAVIRIQREMDRDDLAFEWTDVSVLTATDLQTADKQLFYLMQEIIDDSDDALRKANDGIWDATNIRIKRVADGVNSTDAVNMGQLTAATSGVLPTTIAGYGSFVTAGDAAEDTWVITGGPSGYTADDYLVFLNGVKQKPTTHYTITVGSPDSIVFNSAPPLGQDIEVLWTTGVINSTLADDAVTTAAIEDEAVTVAKIDPGTNGQFLTTTGSAAAWASITASDVGSLASTVKAYRLDEFAVPTTYVSMSSQKLTNVATPTSSGDAVNKAYADALSTAGMYYEAILFTGSDSEYTINPGGGFVPRALMISSNDPTTNFGYSWVFTGVGSTFEWDDSAGTTWSVERDTSTTIRITRSPASGTFHLSAFVLATP